MRYLSLNLFGYLGFLILNLGGNAYAVEAASAKRPFLMAPTQDAVVFGDHAVLDINACGARDAKFDVKVDGQAVAAAEVKPGAYLSQWMVTVPLALPGTHTLEIDAYCWGPKYSPTHLTVSFTSRVQGALEIGEGVANQWMSAHWAKYLKWDWQDAVMLYGLERLGGDYRAYVHEYHERWAKSGLPGIDKADRCPSMLSAMSLSRAGDDVGMGSSSLRVLDYLRNEPRNRLGAIDHLGHSFFSHFIPSSVWVDSLMMTSVFAAQYGRTHSDQALYEYGVTQPLIYASVLQDQASGLFRHAYFIKSRSSLPASASFWLRGNGWVLVSIAEIMDELPADSVYAPLLKDVFVKVADGLAKYQMADGLWGTIANAPGWAYSESSGSLLTSYAIARAVHRGWLDPSYMPMAKRAFAGVSAKLWKTKAGYSIPGNSGATNPTPRWVYARIPQVLDAPYGVGAYLMAAHELRDETF